MLPPLAALFFACIIPTGGKDPLAATCGEFASALRSENHPLQRALDDPHLKGDWPRSVDKLEQKG